MIYCFKCEKCSSTKEVVLSVSERDTAVLCDCDGQKMIRDYQAEFAGKHTAGTWPMESDAAGVNPEQAKEAHAHSLKIGIPTQFNSETGAAIFTSRKHRKDYCQAIGLYDRNGGYGDPQKR
jgi:hypothetical protein